MIFDVHLLPFHPGHGRESRVAFCRVAAGPSFGRLPATNFTLNMVDEVGTGQQKKDGAENDAFQSP